MPQEQWRIVIPDHHPGYITWDRFLANSQRMAANRTNSEVLGGPAREGLCLLQGALVCGHCGRRLSVRYTGNGGIYPIYECNWQQREALSRHARMTLPAKPLDAAVTDRLLAAVTPLTIQLALTALTSLEERDQSIGAQWRLRIERARYEADLAERRYEAVDPANRLIASTLEQRWNDAMQRVIELEAELANFERKTLRTITADQKQQIIKLASDFPRLWTASTTTARDRKRMLRLLIKDITVEKGPEPKRLRLQIRWPRLSNAAPSLQPHYRTFNSTTGCSVPRAPLRYSRPRGSSRLWLLPWRRAGGTLCHRSRGSHVPYESLVELRAAYTPDAARAVSGHPPS